ncbi:MAG: type I glyceraldehyde-3-phosphate dehydrogenase [Hyphomicrobiales bacterium]|nr:MAG: type I glyceraldehyde-3-phosphate dehydrogenase [Hyphomicrobiales bacterium]
MTIRVAINGFGRIGRNILRAIAEEGRTDVQIVAINDLGSNETNALLFKRDSVHGPFPGTVTQNGDILNVGFGDIKMTAIRNPEELPWKELNIDIVFECTGFFVSHEAASLHLKAGAKRVLISAPGKNSDATIVYGVNDSVLSATDIIVSNASCTTNCLAPVASVLQDVCGIDAAFMTTIHAYTGDQRILDTDHSDPRRARAAALSMIPTSTGAAKAIGLVIPELNGKFEGTSVRVPTPNVSCVDLVITMNKPVSAEAVNAAMIEAANGRLKGVLGVNDEPLVSIDFNHNPNSSTFDLTQTQTVGKNMLRILSWYDNEWGFSSRMADTAVVMAKFL